MEDPLVKSAIVVGRAKNQVAVLIEPATETEIDLLDLKALAAFRNAVW